MPIDTKNLLVVSHRYRSFQKDPIDLVSPYFDNVYVLVRFNKFANISDYIHIPALQPFVSSFKIDCANKPSNLEVYKTSFFNLPFDSQYKALGDKHLKVVEELIRKKNIKFDLIHSHFTWSSGYVGAKLKAKYRVPFVVTAHGYDIYRLPFKDDEWKSKIEYVLNSADAIITVSRSNLECIRKLDVKTPVVVLPNGYREDVFHPLNPYECKRSLGLSSDKKIVLTVGNLEEVKGHKYLIEAMGRVVKTRKDVICYIVGEGKLENKLKKQIKSSGLLDYIKLIGGRPHNEIPLWMNACDIFVMPSLKESFGVVQIEAMACGKPVVATYNGGSEEIILFDNYGYLVQPGNSDLLAEKIIIAIDHKWNSEEILKFANKFNLKNQKKQILDLYNLVGDGDESCITGSISN
ncbi:Glycosyl transferase, group 1 [Methanosarcina siciliae T4/M]|uniref:Glycosyl transferase, group 1 n=1 Tax=Methanosarcina siciliae T4/M TaxID=1434120 RepID=A0A0E3L9L9_9EURY|nr:glycosyltransferase family 4 protein [Methanosarcina siciliae]AKB30501.1 Glycosyl transferase, group 1 [Methanosarcina siciliae T4/M]